jgi:cardiolipin synthase
MRRTRRFLTAPPGLGWYLGLCLSLWAAGCRTPAAPAVVNAGASRGDCGRVLARQLCADTAVELVNHPARCTWANLCELREHLASAAVGLAGKRLALGLEGPPPPLPCAPPPADPGGLEDCLQRLTGRDLQPAGVGLSFCGDESLADLYRLIDQAACRIDVLMFYWENDGLAQEVAAHLAARAGPHLRVRVLVDGGGNLVFGKLEHPTGMVVNRVVADLARQPFVEVVRVRNPFARFDHRKLVLVDGRLAWTGGRNFASSAFFKHHDVSFTITGPLVGELQECYDDYWKEQGGAPGPCAAPAAVPPPPPEVNAYARLLASEPGHPELARALYRAVDHARDHVYAENVYFTDSRLVYKLSQARRRGVDVRAVFTFSTNDDEVNRANRVVANRLLRAGVRVYVYPTMTHVKAAAVDGCWVYLGTGNFDMLSLRHNRELGLSVGGGPLIAEVEERLFQIDFRPEWELTHPLPLTCGDYLCELLAGFAL